MEVQLHSLLASTLDEGECLPSRPSPFFSPKQPPVPLCVPEPISSYTSRESNIDFSDFTIVTELHLAASMLSVATPPVRAVSYRNAVPVTAVASRSCHLNKQNTHFYIF